MPNLLPLVFIALASSALILTLLWLWQSLRLALVHATAAPTRVVVSPERGALLSEKQSLLMALKDLEAERDSGKLSPEDFVQLNAQYRRRAVEVLRELDALLAPHRSTARSLLATAASGGTVDDGPAPALRSRDDDAASVAAVSGSADRSSAAAAVVVCPSCQSQNDRDAIFCKKCGARMTTEVVT